MENNDDFNRIVEMNTEVERRKIAAMAMYLFRREVRMSVTGIARILSRHHTTVTQGVRHIGELMTVDKSVRTHHERITDELKKNT